jgi:hypothetical protein
MRPAQGCAALALAARPCDGLGLFGAEKNKLKPEMALPVLARHRAERRNRNQDRRDMDAQQGTA